MIGGAQGSGVDTSANIFARAAASGGLYVFGKREYYSNIKGEHSYFQVRLGKKVLRSHVDTVDMLATFDDETLARHALEVRKDGAIIYDPDLEHNKVENIPIIEAPAKDFLTGELSSNGLGTEMKDVIELARRRGIHIFAVPYREIHKQDAGQSGASSLSSLAGTGKVRGIA